MYGLRGAPKAWQDHYAKIMNLLSGTRLKSEPNVYVFGDHSTLLYVMTYVDDILVIGREEQVTAFFSNGTKHRLVRPTGELQDYVFG